MCAFVNRAGPSAWVAVGQSFVVFSVVAGYPTNTWPCRDALLELIWPLCSSGVYSLSLLFAVHALVSSSCRLADYVLGWFMVKVGCSVRQGEPSLASKRVAAAFVLSFASMLAWFDPEFDQVKHRH